MASGSGTLLSLDGVLGDLAHPPLTLLMCQPLPSLLAAHVPLRLLGPGSVLWVWPGGMSVPSSRSLGATLQKHFHLSRAGGLVSDFLSGS